jgi:hypothetical protein
MKMGNFGQLVRPAGEPVKYVEQAVYLGGLLSTASSAKPEVTRRLGEATGTFKALARCWSHANIARARKVEIYSACVLSKLLYNLESLWLLQADLQRLDAFHIRCLRKIYGIPCSYISRVSNMVVLQASQQQPLSELIAVRQAKLYQRIVELPEAHVLRKLTCEPNSDQPKQWHLTRRRGRPKQQWATCVYSSSTYRSL